MVSALKTEDGVLLEFGGGVHSRASEADIDKRECKSGQNFKLDQENREFRSREPFDLSGTAPNGSSINGFGQFTTAAGVIKTFVQAGSAVYDTDLVSSFTQVATVSASAKLRGHPKFQASELDDLLIITDLALIENVKTWDGTTFTDMTHNLPGGFKARYGLVSNERALYANVESNGTGTPHVIVGSERSNYDNLSVSDRPSSALNEEDPFFLITPDLRAINGLAEGFNNLIMSSGSLWILNGSSAKDFSFNELYPDSGATGTESLANIGNDIVYGRVGRIESVLATDRFGDVQADDITVPIQTDITTFQDWTTIYNSRLSRVYFCPGGSNGQIWVFHKDIQGTKPTSLESALGAGAGLSPWSKWVTVHSSGLNPTAMMALKDPTDGLEYTYWGDSSGGIYKMEGTVDGGDGGSASIATERLSALFDVPFEAEVYSVEGFIEYRKDTAVTVTLTLEFSGENVFNESITINIPAVTGRPVYGGSIYYKNGEYYGTAFAGRLTRQKFAIAGRSNQFQVRARVEDTNAFEISKIGLRFKAAS